MKRLLIIPILSFGLLIAATTPAQAENGSQVGVQATEQQKADSQRELEKYIRIRQRRDRIERTLGHEGKATQVQRHNRSLFRRNVSRGATDLRRSGAFETIPDYAERRPFSNISIEAPNNAKRNFRVRAADYYVEGGEAGREVLLENVRFGTDPAARNVRNFDKILARRGAARVIAQLRNEQRAKAGRVHNSTNYYPFSERIGNASKSFASPFQRFAE